MQELTQTNYTESIKDGAVIVNIGADWCPDCRFISPIIKALHEDYKEKIKFFHVNFSNEETLKDTLNIQRIPTLLFYYNGKEICERLVEPKSQASIEENIKKLLTQMQ